MDANLFTAVPRTLVWLPLILLPLQFVQAYGMRRTMPLATFSLFVRRRRERARRLGLPFREVQVAFGYILLVAIILATSVARGVPENVFYSGAIALVFWAFHRRLLPRRRRVPAAALLMLALAAAGGLGGEPLLQYLSRKLITGRVAPASTDRARQTYTAIGSLGEIKQSPDILWRLIRVNGPLPRLLRIASYNGYTNGTWRAGPFPLSKTDEGETLQGNGESVFIEPDVGNEVRPEEYYRVTARQGTLPDQFMTADEASADGLPRFYLRGAFETKDLFPLPGDTSSLLLPNQNIEINVYGTLQVDPKHPVANALVLRHHNARTALPPWDLPGPSKHSPDLSIPRNERPGIRRVAAAWHLEEGDLRTKINTLRSHFVDDFTYTRYLSAPAPSRRHQDEGFVTRFLEKSHRGHCEYFATASALLLREAGIPTRYATGYAVVEPHNGNQEALVRGVHGHAWCLAWDESRRTWIDVDLTPPDWTGLETPKLPAWQGLLDRWQLLRDDLLVWRSQPGNMALTMAVLFLPLALGGAFIARRLWKSRRRLDPAAARRHVRPQQAESPLHALEKPATSLLGERPTGLPFGRWLLGLEPFLPEKDGLLRAIRLHHTLRFDPAAEPDGLRPELSTLVAEIRREISRRPRL